MIEHLSEATLTALVDGELSPSHFADAGAHLEACPACSRAALSATLLKTAVAKAGRRFEPPASLQARLTHLTRGQGAGTSLQPVTAPSRSGARLGWTAPAWAVAAVLLIAALSFVLYQRASTSAGMASLRQRDLAAEVFDQHAAFLTHNAPPQVISSDRHTVKPWFQGKLPFSFNLPATLPQDVTLDGANLTYLHGQPAAQLVFRIGKHGASVFLAQHRAEPSAIQLPPAFAGFHMVAASTAELEIIAVSDADPAGLKSLVMAMEDAQR